MDPQQDVTPVGARPAAEIAVLIDQLQRFVADPGALIADEAQRLEAKQLARSAAVLLEEPFDTVQRLAYSPLPLVATRIAQEHKIFTSLAASEEPLSLVALKDASGLDGGILESVLDYLCSQEMAREPQPGHYAATKLTQLLMVPLFQDAVTHFHDNCLPGFAALNGVLGKPEKQNAFKAGQHSQEDFYTWLETHPVQQGAFHRFMEAQFASLPTWLDAVDFEAEMGKGLTSDSVAFVDVGGGNGQQCDSLKKKFPELAGRIVLQDRPEVLEKALAVDGMEKMSYDYLTEQPVKDACVYYFRQIMHNNDDETCLRILKSQIPAMGPDSVIVIDDKSLSDTKPPHGAPGVEYTAGLSIAMKVMFDAQERREAHWRELLAKAGLVIKDIRRFTKFEDSVIIAAKN